MSSSITPIRIAPISDRMIRRKRRRPRLGLLACEVLSLAALFTILVPLTAQVRLPSVGRFLVSWPDLSDAHAICRQFVKRAEAGQEESTSREVGNWGWRRLDDGRFRILGALDHPTVSGGIRRIRYQCDLAPLNSQGRWRVDSLAFSRESIGASTALAPAVAVKAGSADR
ncbi:MAG TPA: hypothetical protein VFB89_00950 [Gemmatimonadales bacterium]|nr:hypothetical protein [Gemmatimonadales bacterium]